MGFLYSTYFGLVRINNTGPEAKNWAVTDYNPELTSRIMYALSRHTHGGATPAHYPGYNYATPATPTLIKVAEAATPTAGVLAPGTTLGVRMSYLDATGLETEASPEAVLTLSAVPQVANAPILGVPTATPVAGAMGGGVYLYGITKGLGAGETELSATTLVEVPYPSDSTSSHTVDVTFDPIAEYGDGTDKLKIYRSKGIGSTFSLLKTWTENLATPGLPVTFTDTGPLEDAAQVPPVVTSFNRNKAVEITAAGISHPADMATLRVYITQIPGVYGTNHLFEEVDLSTPTGPNPATPVKNTFNYLGSENLTADYPKDFSQLPTLPGKINLGTEAYGAPTLSADMNFAGYQANNLVLASGLASSTPINGALYYDSTSSSVKFRINGSWVTLATPLGGFSHSENESGGHSAQKIYHSVGAGGTTAYDILSIVATPVPAGQPFRKIVQPVYRSGVQATDLTTTSASFSQLVIVGDDIVPAFAGQYVEFVFDGDFIINPYAVSNPQGNATLSLQLDISTTLGVDTTAREQTYRSLLAPATPTTHSPMHIYFATPISRTVTSTEVKWLVSQGEARALAYRSALYAKLLF
jgi:hypothetical protein